VDEPNTFIAIFGGADVAERVKCREQASPFLKHEL